MNEIDLVAGERSKLESIGGGFCAYEEAYELTQFI